MKTEPTTSLPSENTPGLTPEPAKREPGYYWINSDFNKDFRPRYWNGSLWFVGMDVYVKDDFWHEIDERRITREAEQQQPDTLHVIKQTKNAVTIDTSKITIGAGQPDELSKAQQRVKELEEGITKVLPELVYQSAADPEKWFMWGRSGGDKIPTAILNLMQSVNYKEQP